MYDKLYEQNLNYFHELQLYIATGDNRSEHAQRPPALREEAAQSGEPMAAQIVRDFEQNVDRFRKRFTISKRRKLSLYGRPTDKMNSE